MSHIPPFHVNDLAKAHSHDCACEFCSTFAERWAKADREAPVFTIEQPVGDLIFCAAGMREILRMKPNGTIVFGAGLTQADAAKEFLDLLAQLYPTYLQKPDERLEQELRDARNLIGMLVHAAGGRVEISPQHMLAYEPTNVLTTWNDTASGNHIVEINVTGLRSTRAP